MFRLALRMLRFRKAGFAATFIALFFGAALVMACGGLLETGIRAAAEPQRLAGAQLVVAGDQTFEVIREEDGEKTKTKSAPLPERVRLDRGVADKIRTVPGVAGAVADVTIPVAEPGQQEEGHGWSSAALTPYTITAGQPPTQPNDIAVESGGHRVGDRISLLVKGASREFTVSGIATANHPVTRHAVFFTDATAQSLTPQPDKVDLIGITATPGIDLGQLQSRIGAIAGPSTKVFSGPGRGQAEFLEVQRSSENLIVLAAVIGGFSILVSMFVVASTLGLSIQHRYREMALLRAIGTTPRQLRRMVLGEAMVVAVLAVGVAFLPGLFLGDWLFKRLQGIGLVPHMLEFHQGPIPLAVAGGAGLLTALVAGYVAARRAGNARPTEALTDAGIQKRWVSPLRVIAAALCFGGGTALAIVTVTVFDGPIAASTAGPSVMLWASGLALIAPGITRLVAAALRWPVRALTGNAGYLATLNAKARTVRLAAAVTPIMLATGIATANLYLQTTQVQAAENAYTNSLRADLVLTSTAGTGLSRDLLGAVRSVPGVGAASEFFTSKAFIVQPYDYGQDDGWPVQGITAEGAAATTEMGVTAGNLADLRGNTVALQTTAAGAVNRKVGDTISLLLGDRSTVDVRVVALFNGAKGYDNMLLPADLVAAHTTTGLPAQILVKAASGVDSATLGASLRELATTWPGVAVADRAAVTSAFADGQQMSASVNYLLVGLIMGYAFISVVNTLVMATARRKREFGLQRLTGSTRGQVLRMMGVEAFLVTAIGVVLGTLVSMGTLVPFSVVVTGGPVPYGPLWIYLAIVGAAGLMATVATLVPTLAATRGRPAEAIAAPE